MAIKKSAETTEIAVYPITYGRMDFCILGTTPLILNRMSMKTSARELLLPAGRKTAADKAGSVKHDVIAEFRNSPYTIADERSPALLAVLPTMFKGAMKTAALDMPGTKKAQIGRLVRVTYERMPVFGIPRLFMAVTRSADINRTPDVRTRMILPEWACYLTVEFPKPILREQSIANLLTAGGMQSGIGDWRQEKGSGNYGAFRLASADDPEFVRIIEKMGRAQQIEAIENPEPYDDESEELFSWYQAETARRGFKVAA